MNNGLRINAAVRRRIAAIQSQLYQARLKSDLSKKALAPSLGVSIRTLRDWERNYETPSLFNLLRWSRALGFQLVLVDYATKQQIRPEAPQTTETSWEEKETQRLCMPLKSRRIDREISQTDLGIIVGVSRSSLQRWEDGNQWPRVLALSVVADRLGCSLELRRITMNVDTHRPLDTGG